MNNQFLLVFLGGGVGSLLRYGLARSLETLPSDFPLPTFLANIAACILLGVVTGLAARSAVSEPQRLFLITGVCGGFSTFSTFSGESLTLLQSGRVALAALYIVCSVAACLLGVAAGNFIASR